MQCTVEAVANEVDSLQWKFLIPAYVEDKESFKSACREAVEDSCYDTGIHCTPSRDVDFILKGQ